MIQIGDEMPKFILTDQFGKEWNSESLRGHKTVIYVYPKDNTPGCTAEACSLRDNYEAMLARGYEVIGVSVDSERSHRNFIAKQSLPFHLIADTEKTWVEAFGVWGEKKMCGRTYMGTFRTTFIIDEEGRIERIFAPKEIDTKNHAAQILG